MATQVELFERWTNLSTLIPTWSALCQEIPSLKESDQVLLKALSSSLETYEKELPPEKQAEIDSLEKAILERPEGEVDGMMYAELAEKKRSANAVKLLIERYQKQAEAWASQNVIDNELIVALRDTNLAQAKALVIASLGIKSRSGNSTTAGKPSLVPDSEYTINWGKNYDADNHFHLIYSSETDWRLVNKDFLPVVSNKTCAVKKVASWTAIGRILRVADSAFIGNVSIAHRAFMDPKLKDVNAGGTATWFCRISEIDVKKACADLDARTKTAKIAEVTEQAKAE